MENIAGEKHSTTDSTHPFLDTMETMYHPDKNANGAEAADKFKQIIVKRRQYDTAGAGFQAVVRKGQELKLDLSSLGTVNTMTDKVSAIFSKLGIPIKTTVAASVLEEALNGEVTVHHLQIGQPLRRKVEKQSAHFYSVTITEKEAQAGIVCRVHSSEKSKFKLLYFDRKNNGGLNLALQEDSENTGKVTCAGMCFFQSMAEVKDQDAAFSKKRDAFHPGQIAELKAGTHYFAVYGDNFFMSANYVIEVLCAESFPKEKENVRTVEAQILLKRVKLSKFKTKYEEAVAQYTEVKERHKHEMVVIKELLKQRDKVLASYTIAPQIQCSGSSSSRSKIWQHHSRKMKND